jgi:hypothetical protein
MPQRKRKKCFAKCFNGVPGKAECFVTGGFEAGEGVQDCRPCAPGQE